MGVGRRYLRELVGGEISEKNKQTREGVKRNYLAQNPNFYMRTGVIFRDRV